MEINNKRKPGGGRKLKYGETLKRIVFYIPESKVNEIKTLVKTKLTVGKEKKFFYSETNHVSMYDNNDYEKRFANIDDFLNQFQPSKPSENLINRIKEEFFKEAGKITFKPIGFKANQSFYFKN